MKDKRRIIINVTPTPKKQNKNTDESRVDVYCIYNIQS